MSEYCLCIAYPDTVNPSWGTLFQTPPGVKVNVFFKLADYDLHTRQLQKVEPRLISYTSLQTEVYKFSIYCRKDNAIKVPPEPYSDDMYEIMFAGAPMQLPEFNDNNIKKMFYNGISLSKTCSRKLLLCVARHEKDFIALECEKRDFDESDGLLKIRQQCDKVLDTPHYFYKRHIKITDIIDTFELNKITKLNMPYQYFYRYTSLPTDGLTEKFYLRSEADCAPAIFAVPQVHDEYVAQAQRDYMAAEDVKLTELENQLQKKQAELQDAAEKLKKLDDDLNAKTATAAQEVEERCQAKAEELETAIADKTKELAELSDKCTAEAAKVKNLENESERLSSKKEEAMQELVAKTRTINAELAEKDKTLKSMNSDIEKIDQLYRAKEAAVQSLEREVDDLETRKKELDEGLLMIQQESVQNEKKLDNIKENIDRMGSEQTDSANQLAALQAELASLTAQKGVFAEQEAEARFLDEDLTDKRAELEKLQAEIERLTADRSAALEHVSESKATAHRSQSSIKAATTANQLLIVTATSSAEADYVALPPQSKIEGAIAELCDEPQRTADIVITALAAHKHLITSGAKAEKIGIVLAAALESPEAMVIAVPDGYANLAEVVESVNASKSKVFVLENVLENFNSGVYMALVRHCPGKMFIFASDDASSLDLLPTEVWTYSVKADI